MKTHRLCLLVAVSTCALAAAHAQSMLGRQNSQTPAQKTLYEASDHTGSILHKEMVWSSKIPLNRTYAELTPDQKKYFHSMYESVAPGDEPPFPLEGMKSIVSAITKAQAKLKAQGDLSLVVTVGPDGAAKEVADFSSVNDREMAKFAASVLLMTKFKPAICAKAACTMQFPFNLRLKPS